MAKERIVSAEAQQGQESDFNRALRPAVLQEYIGQERLIEKLSIAITASKGRDEPMEHVLLHGPPGLGKTTLAHVIAEEMGTQLVITSGPAITKGADLVGALTKLQSRDVLFIDEIHRLSTAVEEYLYSAMEDFKIDFVVDSGMHAKTITLPIKPFTLIGATTRAGLVTGPMRSRFGVTHHLEFYEQAALEKIVTRSAGLLGLHQADDDAISLIASRSRGTPRVANRLLRRVRDYAEVRAGGKLTAKVVEAAMLIEEVDTLGLDRLDHAYLRAIMDIYEGGPVGLEAIAATLNEDSGTLEDMVEPYLLQIGFVARTRRGRQVTRQGAEHLGYIWKAKPEFTEHENLGDNHDVHKMMLRPQTIILSSLFVLFLLSPMMGCGARRSSPQTSNTKQTNTLNTSGRVSVRTLKIDFDEKGDPLLTPIQQRLLSVHQSASAAGTEKIDQLVDQKMRYRNPEFTDVDSLAIELPDGMLTTPGEIAQAAEFSRYYLTQVGPRFDESAIRATVLLDGQVVVGGVKYRAEDSGRAIGDLLVTRDENKVRIYLQPVSGADQQARRIQRFLLEYFSKPPVPVLILND